MDDVDAHAPSLRAPDEPAPTRTGTAIVSVATGGGLARQREDFVLRQSRVTDLADIERVERDCFPGRGYSSCVLRQFFELQGALLLVAVRPCTDRCVGYALGGLSLQPGPGWILSLGVSHPWRGRGVGRALTLGLLTKLSELPVQVVRLTVHPANASAGAFYAGLGFLLVDQEADYFGPGHPRIVMELRRDGPEPFRTASAARHS